MPLSVKTLKRTLKKAGLKTTGRKAALTRRAKKAHLMRGGDKDSFTFEVELSSGKYRSDVATAEFTESHADKIAAWYKKTTKDTLDKNVMKDVEITSTGGKKFRVSYTPGPEATAEILRTEKLVFVDPKKGMGTIVLDKKRYNVHGSL